MAPEPPARPVLINPVTGEPIVARPLPPAGTAAPMQGQAFKPPPTLPILPRAPRSGESEDPALLDAGDAGTPYPTTSPAQDWGAAPEFAPPPPPPLSPIASRDSPPPPSSTTATPPGPPPLAPRPHSENPMPLPPVNASTLTSQQIAALPAHYFVSEEREVLPNRVPPGAVMAAAGGAGVGFVVWGVADSCICTPWALLGVLAWGIGHLVGYVANYMGGRGPRMGGICAAFAMLALLMGTVLSTLLLPLMTMIMLSDNPLRPTAGGAKEQSAEQEFFASMIEDDYNRQLMLANAFEDVRTMDDVRYFMIANGYSYADDPSEIDAFAVDEFEREYGDDLRAFKALYPDFETYKAAMTGGGGNLAGAMADGFLLWVWYRIEALFIGPGLLFTFLAMVAAFFVGGARDGDA